MKIINDNSQNENNQTEEDAPKIEVTFSVWKITFGILLGNILTVLFGLLLSGIGLISILENMI